MKHLTELELIEHAYREDGGAAQEHLAACGECGREFADLKSELGEFGRMEPPLRDDGYGERVWRSISSSLKAYEAPKRSWLGVGRMHGGWMRGLSYAAVCALLVGMAFYAGRKWEQRSKTPAAAQNAAQKPKQPIVVVVLGDHLDRSERLLVELKHADVENTETVTPLPDEARSLLAANKVCRHDAEKTGDPALEGALDRLDHLLNEIANQPAGLNAASLARLKDEMDADGLLFEVRVLRSRVRDNKPVGAAHLSGGAI